MTDQWDEHRQSKRITRHFMLSYYEMDKPNAPHDSSQIKNISKEGICFTTSVSYPQGTILGMTLATPYLSEPAELVGAVLESKELMKGMFETRLIFHKLDANAESVINAIYEGDKSD